MTVNSQGITYKLNGLGQRVSEAFSGNTTHYIHDVRGNVIAEADGSTGTTTMEYVWMEGELLAQIDGSGNIVYVHNSQVGAPQKITNPSRTLVCDQIREPFGEIYSTPTSTTPTNWRFPGQYANANNSLSHNGARDYDPSIPGYVEADPMGLSAGPNLFAYAGQNPMQATDPWGLEQHLQFKTDPNNGGGENQNYWTGHFVLSDPSPNGGYVIQHIVATVTVDGPTGTATKKYDFYEAFKNIPKKSQRRRMSRGRLGAAYCSRCRSEHDNTRRRTVLRRI